MWSREGTGRIDGPSPKKRLADHPYFTQTGRDREGDGDQYIANMQDGAVAGFKSFAFDTTEKSLRIEADGSGFFEVSPDESFGELWASVPAGGQAPFTAKAGTYPLYFRYRGGDTAAFRAFTGE